jgi:hypothetical protein
LQKYDLGMHHSDFSKANTDPLMLEERSCFIFHAVFTWSNIKLKQDHVSSKQSSACFKKLQIMFPENNIYHTPKQAHTWWEKGSNTHFTENKLILTRVMVTWSHGRKTPFVSTTCLFEVKTKSRLMTDSLRCQRRHLMPILILRKRNTV